MPSAPGWRVSRLAEPIVVDGRLAETCYSQHAPIADFKMVSRPTAPPPETKAWILWDERGLWFAFAARDLTIVAAPWSANERAVDAQDRVEIFLWPEGSARYFCIEVAPGGAVHDYAARPYRIFDDAWSPAGAQFAVERAPDGYAVEGFLPLGALRAMGVGTWRAGTRFHPGLYRADFRPGAPDDPVWLTWIDPKLPQPDFHVRATFALVELGR